MSIQTADIKADIARQDGRNPGPLYLRMFPLILTCAYLIVAGVNIATHELFRDECQAWLVALNSRSLVELTHPLHYEGHPILWYLLLHVVGQFTHHPEAMQILHLLIAGSYVYILARYSPFGKAEKILIAFSYLLLYQYSTVSRNYGLGVLLLFAFCAIYPVRKRAFIPISLVVCLLANTSAYGWVLAVALTLGLIFDWLMDYRTHGKAPSPVPVVVIGALVAILGLATAAYQCMPAPDCEWKALSLPSIVSLGMAASAVGRGCLLVPDFLTQWQFGVEPLILVKLHAVAGLAILVFFALAFVRRREVFFLYCAASLGLLGFNTVKWRFGVYHYGFQFLVFVVCLWLAQYYPISTPSKGLLSRLTDWGARHARSVFIVILVVQVACGMIASVYEWCVPFSMSKRATDFIRRNYPDAMLVGDGDAWMSPIVAYLDRPVFCPVTGKMTTYTIWKQKRHKATEAQLWSALTRLASSRRQVLLVMNTKLPPDPPGNLAIKEVAGFEGSMVVDESYWLYTVGTSGYQTKASQALAGPLAVMHR